MFHENIIIIGHFTKARIAKAHFTTIKTEKLEMGQ